MYKKKNILWTTRYSSNNFQINFCCASDCVTMWCITVCGRAVAHRQLQWFVGVKLSCVLVLVCLVLDARISKSCCCFVALLMDDTERDFDSK